MGKVEHTEDDGKCVLEPDFHWFRRVRYPVFLWKGEKEDEEKEG